MKKAFLAMFIIAYFATTPGYAQESDSVAIDTVKTGLPVKSNSASPADQERDKGKLPGDDEEGKTAVQSDENDSTRSSREARQKKEKIEAQLEEMVSYPLNLETTNLSSFQVLDSIADHNRFIFTGEDHRVEKFNTTLEMKMMQYLSTRGYQYYLMEAGWVSAWMVNRYILKGDSAAEQILSTYYSKNFFAMFKGLKEANDSLPESKKITAVGLDIERDAPLALRSLLLMLPDKSTPDSLEMFTESLKILSGIHIEQARSFSENAGNGKDIFDFGSPSLEFDEFNEVEESPKYFYFNMMRTVQDLTQRFRSKEPAFKDYLGDAYPEFERTVKELENWLIWIGYEQDELPQSWVFREQYMEGNFRTYFKDKPEAKGFGQFGRCHITRITKVGDCGFAFFSSLNKRIISRMPELENQLSSIGIFYGGLDRQNVLGDNGNITDLIRLTDKGTVNLFMDLQDYGDEMLRSKFSAIIVVKSVNYLDETEDDEVSLKKKKPNSFMSLDFNMIVRSYDMKSFNDFTQFGVDRTFKNYEFGMSFVSKERITANLVFGFTPEMERRVADTSLLRLSGSNISYTWGKDLIRSKLIEFTPQLGVGFIQLQYSEEISNTVVSNFKSPYYAEFNNPAFLIDARLNMGIVIGVFEFKGILGYNLDVSKKSWKQNGNIINGGPKTNFSGFYSGAGLSFHISTQP